MKKNILTLSVAMLCILSCNNEMRNKNTSMCCASLDWRSAVAIYYGEPVSDVEKYYKLSESNFRADSHTVHSLGITVLHFYDIRDTTPDERYWKTGVVCMNAVTGNSFVFAVRRKGLMIRGAGLTPDGRPHFFERHELAGKTDTSFPLFEDNLVNHKPWRDSFEIYTFRNTGVALKLAAILNDIPVSYKSNLTRDCLDSLIMFYLFSNQYVSLQSLGSYSRDILDDRTIEADNPFLPMRSKRRDIDSGLNSLSNYHKLYKYYVKMSLYSNNFVYHVRSPLLFDDMEIMVTINEDIPYGIDMRNSYKLFNCEPTMYNVKIYSENT